MTGDELRAWMDRNGWSINRLAEQIDVDRRTVIRWRQGEWPVPRVAELAIQSLGRSPVHHQAPRDQRA